tara:strand:+ start:759 stop:1280 length:522 start_codon:yes stop_codon:yes gene_type:complete
MSQLKVNSIVPVGGLPSGANGGIIQVVQTVKSDVSSFSVATRGQTANVMTVSITPSSSSNKILLICNLNAQCGTTGYLYSFNRGGTEIGLGDALTNRRRMSYGTSNTESNQYSFIGGMFLDSPATTSAVTYGIKLTHTSSNTQTIVVNNQNTGSTDLKFCVTMSTLTAMEVTV